MNKAIFFKEWIKTRGLFFIALLVSLCFAGYVMMRINRVITFKGADHLWAILLSRDTVFIELLQYLPLIIGALFASLQFIPEMTQKRLKLTLHLPYPQQRMILLMLLAGVAQISIVFLLQAASLWIYLQQHIACEMVARILLTAAPWYICGYTAYLMTAWICLEPTWKLPQVSCESFSCSTNRKPIIRFCRRLLFSPFRAHRFLSGRLSDSKKVAKTNFKNGILQ